MVNCGQSLAGLAEDVVDPFDPIATFEGMEGLFVVMKFPHICLNAVARSGPIFAAAGPKSGVRKLADVRSSRQAGEQRVGTLRLGNLHPLTSLPCKAGSTEN
jgi:hypothetical protein